MHKSNVRKKPDNRIHKAFQWALSLTDLSWPKKDPYGGTKMQTEQVYVKLMDEAWSNPKSNCLELLPDYLDFIFSNNIARSASEFRYRIPTLEGSIGGSFSVINGEQLIRFVNIIMNDKRVRSMPDFKKSLLKELQEYAYPWDRLLERRYTTDTVRLQLQKLIPNPDPENG